jgi:hypothetical protein
VSHGSTGDEPEVATRVEVEDNLDVLLEQQPVCTIKFGDGGAEVGGQVIVVVGRKGWWKE